MRSSEMSQQLDEFWSEFDQNDALHVAIITGAGRAFCAGRDLVRPDAHNDEIKPGSDVLIPA